jgi:hypothetical protein
MSIFLENNNDYLFELSEKINCHNISCYEKQKNRNIFAERAIDCKAYANENNYLFSDYLEYDKWIVNKCNPYKFNSTIKPSTNCMGFQCNNDTFLIKPSNKHTYRNGLRYNEDTNKYCSLTHQIWNNMPDKCEIRQHCQESGYAPIISESQGRCKPINNMADYVAKK